jgi:radical SAM protein with 4Fe4S-binding SPASM domain
VQADAFEACNAGISTLGITASGDVKGCLALPGMVEGNVRSDRLRDLWTDPERFAANRRFETGDLGELCRGCVHGESCRGGCMEVSLTVTGRPHNAPFCLHRNEREGST